MKKLIPLLALSLLAGCATVAPVADNVHEVNGKLLAGATKINRVTDKIIRRAGPLVTTGVCIVQPQDCEAAKAAYSLARTTHNQITATIAGLTVVYDADPGTKLATLYQQFQLQIDDVNKLITKYGGDPLDMTEFNAAVEAAGR